MGLPVTIKVNFRGNVKRFLAQDVDKLEWESVEAWIKASFGINHFQVKYFDEDNEEICINSQDEYEEAIKSAEKQGNQLHMNVYKMKGQACGGPLKAEVKELKGDLRPAPPYPSRVKSVDKGTQITPERESVAVKENKGNKPDDDPPPMWFRSYMEKFKDEVVKEVVERMCNDFSGQCCTHKSSDGLQEDCGAIEGPIGPRPGPSTSNGSLGYTPNCSTCNKLTSEGAYKCSVCPSCILCEMCRHSHDPSHSLVRTKTPLSIPEHGMSASTLLKVKTRQKMFPRRGDRTVRKAERQRLKAERRQLKAEVKEIKKKLRLEKRGMQWRSRHRPRSHPSPGPRPPGLQSRTMLCTLETRGPGVSHTSLVPTMAALFLDENLPDNTRLEPGTKFIKYWKMKNSGTISWTSETKLVFMWGNLGLASEERREVPVPLLLPGQVGVVSVAFVAPVMEGMYTSHWRLAHCGCQFGPRVWCSIVVDSGSGRNGLGHQSKRLAVCSTLCLMECQGSEIALNSHKRRRLEAAAPGYMILQKAWRSVASKQDFYFPSVDLLTAQDLLSFELLDINIVQELEKVPNNTPVALTPCISPLPNDSSLLERTMTSQTKDESETTGVRKLFGVKLRPKDVLEPVAQDEEKEEEISGAQFLCETVIRSLTLEEAPDHRPLRRAKHSSLKPQDPEFGAENDNEDKEVLHTMQNMKEKNCEKEEGRTREDWDEVSSQTSSVSSSDDYIIVLPDCFDTSRPLGESMYSSAMSQPDTAAASATAASSTDPDQEQEKDEPCNFEPCREAPLMESSVNQMLCASQTLDAVTLTPEVVPPPVVPQPLHPTPTHVPHLYHPVCPDQPAQHAVPLRRTIRERAKRCSQGAKQQSKTSYATISVLGQGGITEGLVKGALSVAASAYKALFTGPNCSIQGILTLISELQDPSMMAVLLEMGFKDQQLNQQLLRKHGYNLLHTVNELVQMAEESQNE
uniref:NBR1 autophagy cargo receptor a n=1 Tax=Poecilia formosa TaxID=48698 RepID=A0A087YHY2_POEFO